MLPVIRGVWNIRELNHMSFKYILVEAFFVACVCTFLYFNAFYVPNKARIAAKLCQNAFRTIPDISFFDKMFFVRNFERPFTPRGWLRLASNFGKTRFRRSPTFHFSTLKTSKNIEFFWQNFERPFTPRGWLRSASNFGKTRFRRSPTFHLSTSKKTFRQNFSTKTFARIFLSWLEDTCVLARRHKCPG